MQKDSACDEVSLLTYHSHVLPFYSAKARMSSHEVAANASRNYLSNTMKSFIMVEIVMNTEGV